GPDLLDTGHPAGDNGAPGNLRRDPRRDPTRRTAAVSSGTGRRPVTKGLPVIQYSCPACQVVLEAQDNMAGKKIICPKCGQRLLIPSPTRNKTILGQLLSDPAPSTSLSLPGTQPPFALPPPGSLLVNCPGCRFPVMISSEVVGRRVGCSICGTAFDVKFRG